MRGLGLTRNLAQRLDAEHLLGVQVELEQAALEFAVADAAVLVLIEFVEQIVQSL